MSGKAEVGDRLKRVRLDDYVGEAEVEVEVEVGDCLGGLKLNVQVGGWSEDVLSFSAEEA